MLERKKYIPTPQYILSHKKKKSKMKSQMKEGMR
jgi:hypothetical protein